MLLHSLPSAGSTFDSTVFGAHLLVMLSSPQQVVMSLAVAAGRPCRAQCWLCCSTLPVGSPPPSTARATSGTD